MPKLRIIPRDGASDMAEQSVPVGDSRYVTVRRVAHNKIDYAPGTEFPGPDNECTGAELAALLRCGAIREPDRPPMPAPKRALVLGDEELPGGEARHAPRQGAAT